MRKLIYRDIETRLQPPLDCAKEGDLRGLEFHNRLILNGKGVDFSGCVFYHCFPSGLEGALEISPAKSQKDVTLEYADLQGAYLWRADLQGANLQGANLQGANLAKANLQGANLEGADFRDVNFRDTKLLGANFKNANLQNANLTGHQLHDVNLQGANLRGAYLTFADLKGADIRGADLQGAKMILASYTDDTNFEGSNISKDQLASMKKSNR